MKFKTMLLGTKKRTRVSDEESDNNNENGEVFGDVMINVKNKDKEKVGNGIQKDLKRMRLDLGHDTSRGVPFEFFNSSTESSPRTPSSHSTHTDTTEYTSSAYPYHQVHQHQQQRKQSSDNISLSGPNTHKLHRNPIRISTRSDASSSSSTELLNPYMKINSVLYLANLTRTSHIVNELQDDLGCMEIDERVDSHNNGRGRLMGNGASMEDDDSVDSMNELSHDHHQFQNGEYVNEDSSEVMSRYQSINAILRDAFLRRHQDMDAQI